MPKVCRRSANTLREKTDADYAFPSVTWSNGQAFWIARISCIRIGYATARSGADNFCSLIQMNDASDQTDS